MYTTQKYNDGSYYVGSVNERNQKHGYGTIYWGKDCKFVGKWSYDYPVSGVCYFPDGYRYEGEVSTDKDNFVITGNGKSFYTNGDVYIGFHLNEKPSCNGKMYYSNGNVAKGFFTNSKISKGEFIFSSGSIYKGDFYYDEHSVKIVGTFKKYNGEFYEGTFTNFQLDGPNITYFYHKTKIEYQGQWKNGFYDGVGKLYFRNGDIYEGKFENGLFHGKGIVKSIGLTIKGNWKNGVYDGKIIYENIFDNKRTVKIYKDDNLVEIESEKTLDKNRKIETILYKNGSLYVGEVKNNKPNGIGILYLDRDDKTKWYKGYFKNGKLNGQGICELNDYRYEGIFKNGKIYGQGIMKHKDRSGETSGFFKNNIPNGYCRLTNQITNIISIEGIYNGYCFKGNVSILFKDKRRYYGHVNGFIPNGKGIMEYPNGSIIKGKFKKGIPDGEVIIVENNIKYDGYYKNGTCIKKRKFLLDVK